MKHTTPIVETLETRTLMSVSHYPGLGESHERENTTGVIKPAAPTDLAGTVNGTAVTLNWTDTSDNELGFIVFRKGAKGKMTLIGRVDPNVTTYTDTTAPESAEQYIVMGYNQGGNSRPSNLVNVQIPSLVQVIAPRQLKSKALSTTSILVSWDKDYGATNGYIIERSTDGTTFTQVGTKPAGTKSFTDTGLTLGTKYYYRITAVGPENHTAVSAVLIGMTKMRDKGDNHGGQDGDSHHEPESHDTVHQ